MAPATFRRKISQAIAGVGAKPSHTSTCTPRAPSTAAASATKASESNRGSHPTSSVGRFDWASTWSATAAVASLTLENVNWTAITARQPDVPNLIGDVPTGSYSMSAAARRNRQFRARRESVNEGDAAAASPRPPRWTAISRALWSFHDRQTRRARNLRKRRGSLAHRPRPGRRETGSLREHFRLPRPVRLPLEGQNRNGHGASVGGQNAPRAPE